MRPLSRRTSALIVIGLFGSAGPVKAQFHSPYPRIGSSPHPVLALRRSPTLTEGSGGIAAFTDLSSGFASDRAYLTTSILTAYTGIGLFELTGAHVVSVSDTADTKKRKSIQDQTSTITKLIQNDGELAMRLILPTPTSGDSVSTFVNNFRVMAAVGYVGKSDTTAADDQRVAAGPAVEYLGALNLFEDQKRTKPIGQLLYGVRGGVTKVFNGTLGDIPDNQSVRYGQFVLGVRAHGVVMAAATFNVVQKSLKDYVPTVQWVLSASVK